MRQRSWGRNGAAWAALVGFVIVGSPALAQDLTSRAATPPADAAEVAGLAPTSDQDVTFSSATLDYDDNADIVTATGDVRMLRNGNRLRADKVTWNRATGEVRATGNVALANRDGDTAYADDILLTDEMHDGVADNMVLADGGRLAARHGERRGDRTVLDHAAYTPCSVEGNDGCPKRPSWQITALRVVIDQGRHRIFYHNARLALFGQTILALPSFSHPDGSEPGSGGSGLLLPQVQVSNATGLEYAQPYYRTFGPNRDLTITPHLYTKVLPALEGTYRALDANGAYRVSAMGTYGSRLPASVVRLPDADKDRGIRGYIDANGTWQFGPYWTVSGAARVASDRTFMKRYDISNDDRLRSTVKAERIDPDSYLSVAGWFVQDLRPGFNQGQQPIALPAVDYRKRFADPWLGGTFQAQANSLSLIRTDGQDTQRVFGGLRWDLRKLTDLGQEVTFTAYGRTDLYHTNDVLATATPLYRGAEGWHVRQVAALAADMRWPFVGEVFGGNQTVTPRVQVVASPHTKNLVIPDEDARAVDLEDSNLFALNRFSGYDRWEDSSRVTYGGEYNFALPRFEVRAVIGQSYRLTSEPTLLPAGTGLSERFSDYVGRVSVRYGDWIEFTHRFRLDKDNLAIRRNEIDAIVGSRTTYLQIGYLRLNRDIDPSIEDLRDRTELRLGGRVRLARYWSVFGSTVVDLTSSADDPGSLSDGYEPVRQRLGVQYEDECVSLGLTWRRDYDPTGDARRGSTFSLRLALKNVGR
ncbi:LPS assembly protein LptD [uncultured Sphingomonas sp.]|uniref:LPS-assembly protein LptD n=1 Tax=uncultured Sphingomonas sp. TaxID=158754 RepID=UPI0025FA9251|nr:LPS assembly protein LptD [uncultured Sphingomonas sp.]